MNLETSIDRILWNTIRTNYENRNFTGAILDSIYHLSNTIRDKTGLESDGVSLVGQALGGNSPKLRLTELKSESDKNIQTGIEQILRGVYSAIRNPRSHEKYNDAQKDADVLIIFIDYLLGLIDKSRTHFNKPEFLKRVFDDDFVEKDRYAELLVNEIPVKQRFEILIEVFRKKETGNGVKIGLFFKKLFNILADSEKLEIINLVSDELKTTEDTDTIRTIIQVFPSKEWPKIDESARLRTENKLIKSVKQGKMQPDLDRCQGGSFGTWATNIIDEFSLKDELAFVLGEKLLSENHLESDYVFKFFFQYLENSFPKIHWKIIEAINTGLKKGDKRFFDALNGFWDICNENSDWAKNFRTLIDSFQEIEPEKTTISEDDLPF